MNVLKTVEEYEAENVPRQQTPNWRLCYSTNGMKILQLLLFVSFQSFPRSAVKDHMRIFIHISLTFSLKDKMRDHPLLSSICSLHFYLIPISLSLCFTPSVSSLLFVCWLACTCKTSAYL